MFGPLICLATLQISSVGKRIILYSYSCEHTDLGRKGRKQRYQKLSDEIAKREIANKLKNIEFVSELVALARKKPAFDIAIGFDDSKKH